MNHLIITIDGPAGAGKSSVSRALAKRLGFEFLDTGAMYRAVALAALDRRIDLNDSAALADLIQQLNVQVRGSRVFVNGQDVTDRIRTPDVTQAVRFVADSLPVREHLSVLQRRAAATGPIVTEGRDQGTVVFPHADCKIFLTASPQERARRRHQEMRAKGVEISEEDVLKRQAERDGHDSGRTVGRLAKAEDAVEFQTDRLSVDQVIDRLESIVRQRLSPTRPPEPGK